MVHIILGKGTHKRLLLFKVENDFRTFDDAVKGLLEKINRESGEKVNFGGRSNAYDVDFCLLLLDAHEKGASYRKLAKFYGLPYKEKVARMVRRGKEIRYDRLRQRKDMRS